MFFEPARTPYDLNFRLFGVDVRVHPWFWLMSVMLGWSTIALGGFGYLLLWIACVFISILVHEFGHIFMGIAFRSHGHIVLYSMGGLASGSNRLAHHWQRILVCLAGPAAGFLFFGLVWVFAHYVIDVTQAPRTMRATYLFLAEINLFWGFLNLLPIWPLDGGQVSRDLLDWIIPGRGVRIALGLSLVTAGVLAVNALYLHTHERSLGPLQYVPYLEYAGGLWLAFLFGVLAFNSFQALQVESQRRPWDKEDNSWNR